MTLEEMLDRMSSTEILEWMAYNVLENEDSENRRIKAETDSQVRR
jgi:hypothetical protein